MLLAQLSAPCDAAYGVVITGAAPETTQTTQEPSPVQRNCLHARIDSPRAGAVSQGYADCNRTQMRRKLPTGTL
jgi:hypothetical protein